MLRPSKTADQTLISHQEVASGGVVISSEVDVSQAVWGELHLDFGRLAAAALSAAVIFRPEVCSKESSTAGHWRPVFPTGIATDTVACEAEAVSGTVNAGQAVITVASTTNLAQGDKIYIDNTTTANSEWGIIKSIVTNTSVTLEENLANAQTGATLYDRAERRVIPVDLFGAVRFRLVVDGAGGGQAFAVRAFLVTTDGFEDV